MSHLGQSSAVNLSGDEVRRTSLRRSCSAHVSLDWLSWFVASSVVDCKVNFKYTICGKENKFPFPSLPRLPNTSDTLVEDKHFAVAQHLSHTCCTEDNEGVNHGKDGDQVSHGEGSPRMDPIGAEGARVEDGQIRMR